MLDKSKPSKRQAASVHNLRDKRDQGKDKEQRGGYVRLRDSREFSGGVGFAVAGQCGPFLFFVYTHKSSCWTLQVIRLRRPEAVITADGAGRKLVGFANGLKSR